MENHSNKRKLYVETECSTKGIDLGKLLYYPSEEIMKKYLLTEEEIVTYTYQGMLSRCWNNAECKYEDIILPNNKVYKSQKRLDRTLESLLWGPMFDYIIFSANSLVICIIKVCGTYMDCIFLFGKGGEKHKYNIDQINQVLHFLERYDLIDSSSLPSP